MPKPSKAAPPRNKQPVKSIFKSNTVRPEAMTFLYTFLLKMLQYGEESREGRSIHEGTFTWI
jgi:hypothetical protein